MIRLKSARIGTTRRINMSMQLFISRWVGEQVCRSDALLVEGGCGHFAFVIEFPRKRRAKRAVDSARCTVISRLREAVGASLLADSTFLQKYANGL